MAFNILPLEVNVMIAGYLETDVDVASFSSICQSCHAAVACDRSPLWRILYAQRFDYVVHASFNDYRVVYQSRRKYLRRGANFTTGTSKEESRCLQVIRALILESYSNSLIPFSNGNNRGMNLRIIQRFVENHNLLQTVCSRRIKTSKLNPLLTTVRVMLAHLLFDDEYDFDCLGFPDSQKAVYKAPRDAPCFKGPKKSNINISWILEIINFFRYHMLHPQGQLCNEFASIPASARPKPWKTIFPKTAYNLGRRWKGTYSYLQDSELPAMRSSSDDVIIDSFAEHEGGFQTMELMFPNSHNTNLWPAHFERHLNSLNHPSFQSFCESYSKSQKAAKSTTSKHTRAQQFGCRQCETTVRKDSENSDQSCDAESQPQPFSFTGVGHDGRPADRYHVFGWLTPLRSQSEFPGWLRFTMMKFFVSDWFLRGPPQYAGADPRTLSFDMSMVERLRSGWVEEAIEYGLWAYEGVVLPGGQIIVGRWWAAGEEAVEHGPDGGSDCYSGPFIFWCTDDREEEMN